MNRGREKVRFTWVAPSSTVFFNLWTSSIKGISVSIATGLLRSEESTYIENYVEKKGKQKKTKNTKGWRKDFQSHAKKNESRGSELTKRSNSDLLHLSVLCALVEVQETNWFNYWFIGIYLGVLNLKMELRHMISRDHRSQVTPSYRFCSTFSTNLVGSKCLILFHIYFTFLLSNRRKDWNHSCLYCNYCM